jgi:hypothetical protein
MKQPMNNHRSQARGEGLVIVIILIAVIGAGVWWLYSTKAQSDKQARAFGREMIERLAVQHDQAFFANNLGPEARNDWPRSAQDNLFAKLKELGAPAQPIKIDEMVTFESQFFAPRGIFTAHLNYPGQPVTLELAVSHPVAKWQVDNLTMTWAKVR